MFRVGSPLTWAAAQHAAAPVVSVALVTALAAPPPVAPVTPVLVDVAIDVEAAAIDLAHELRAVPADPTDRLCDRDDLAVRWSEPVGYAHGAHLTPVGPRPTTVTTGVNGAVVCGDSTWAYMGFEATRTATGWDVVGVPYIEEEQGDVASLNLDAGPIEPRAGGDASHADTSDADHAHEDAEPDRGGVPSPSTPPAAALPSPAAPTASVPGERWLAGLGPIEPYAAYDPQTSCSPTARPGTVVVRDALLGAHPGTRNLGIARACHIGGRSEHKEGRAFDWGAYVSRPVERAAVERFVQQLFATDADGNTHALARRMGVMYLVWSGEIWSSYRASEGWRPYSGPSPHTDHIHISFSRAGADGRTSFFSQGLAGRGVLGLVPTGGGSVAPVAAPVAATPRVTAPARSPEPTPGRGERPTPRPTPTSSPALSRSDDADEPTGHDEDERRAGERLEEQRRQAEKEAASREQERLDAERREAERREVERLEAERRRLEEARREEERRREDAERAAEKAAREAERQQRDAERTDTGPPADRGGGPPAHEGKARGRGRG